MFDRDLFGHPIGTTPLPEPVPDDPAFDFGGRALRVIRECGDDDAAPVIVEELTNRVTLKGQYALWSRQGVKRAKERDEG